MSICGMKSSHRQLAMHAPSTSWFAILFSIVLLVATGLGNGQEAPSLMTMIGRWQYPGSKISGATLTDAATMNAAGERTRPSVQYRAVLTTKDSIPKVTAYYENSLKPSAASKTAQSEQSVTSQDDSRGRPVAIHMIFVNTETSSTTLVITRAESESETHIAWARYERH